MFALIEWNDRLTLGVPSLDRQHREIVDLLNRLTLLAQAGTPSPEEAVELLARLHRHTLAHFEHEEQLMADIGYVEQQGHHGEHRLLLAELKSFTRQLDCGAATLDGRTVHALRHWLLVHIVETDRDLAAALGGTASP